jgi:hypothetical protein
MVRPAAQAKDVMSFGPFSLVASERLLTKDGVPVALSARAFDTLVILLSRPKDARPEEGRGTPLPTLPRPHAKQQRVARAQRQSLLRPDGLAGRERDLEAPHHGREHECHLLQRKSCADAHARSDAERQVGVAIDLCRRILSAIGDCCPGSRIFVRPPGAGAARPGHEGAIEKAGGVEQVRIFP